MSVTADVVACTTGTSIVNNVKGVGEGFAAWLARQPEADRGLLAGEEKTLLAAWDAMRDGRWDSAGERLGSLAGTPRVLGAELTSLGSMRSAGPYDRIEQVVLLHSDSSEGEGAARAIRGYLREKGGAAVDLVRIEELQARRTSRFRVVGLRNLVRELADVYRRRCGGNRFRMVVNATGGYKAQIGVAVVFGQVFGVRVVYQHEEFREFIEFPPLPVRLDPGAVLENLDLVRREVIPAAELEDRFGPLTESNEAWARFQSFVFDGRVDLDGQDSVLISPLAELVLDRWRYETPIAPPAIPAAEKQTVPDWTAHHQPKEVREFVERLLADCPWISRVEARSAAGRGGAKGVSFRLGPEEPIPDILMTYVANNHPALLALKTTARNRRDQEDALRWLDHLYARD